LGGPLEGPVLQQGELSMVCVGLSERDLKNFGGATGARQNFRGQWPPWHLPSSAPGFHLYIFFTMFYVHSFFVFVFLFIMLI